MEETYDKMLDRGLEKLPKKKTEHERFEIPQFFSFVEGNKTVIKNFTEVIKILHRDEVHLLKYILDNVGTAGEKVGQRVILKGRHNSSVLNTHLTNYVNKFVLCKECKRPDTVFVSESGILRLKCNACGAKYTITGSS